jgi:hypothetical protein
MGAGSHFLDPRVRDLGSLLSSVPSGKPPFRGKGYLKLPLKSQGLRFRDTRKSPLRVGLIMLVPVMLDHAIAAYSDVWT